MNLGYLVSLFVNRHMHMVAVPFTDLQLILQVEYLHINFFPSILRTFETTIIGLLLLLESQAKFLDLLS